MNGNKAEIPEYKKKCGLALTDVFGLCFCIDLWIEELIQILEEENKYKGVLKMGVNRAKKHIHGIVNSIYASMLSYNPNFERLYNTMSDDLIAKIDNEVHIEGTERVMNMITNACYLINEKVTMIKAYGFVFEYVGCVERAVRVLRYLREIKFTQQDLLPIFREQLLTQYSDRWKMKAKQE